MRVLLASLPLLVLLAWPTASVSAGEDDKPPAPVAEEKPAEKPAAPVEAPPPPPAGHVETLAAWTWLETANAFRTGLYAEARKLRLADKDKSHQELSRTAFMDVLHAARKVTEAAQEEFRAAFERSDWDAWDAATHPDLLEQGLDMAARHALESDPARAIEIFDRLIAALPESRSANYARTTWLPIALPATGDFDLARTRLAALHATADEKQQPGLLKALGDLEALAGKYEAAQAKYQEAMDGIPTDADRRDPRGRLRGYLELRLKLVGQPAPDITGGLWFGGEAKPLSAFKGKVVLLDYWATW